MSSDILGKISNYIPGLLLVSGFTTIYLSFIGNPLSAYSLLISSIIWTCLHTLSRNSALEKSLMNMGSVSAFGIGGSAIAFSILSGWGHLSAVLPLIFFISMTISIAKSSGMSRFIPAASGVLISGLVILGTANAFATSGLMILLSTLPFAMTDGKPHVMPKRIAGPRKKEVGIDEVPMLQVDEDD